MHFVVSPLPISDPSPFLPLLSPLPPSLPFSPSPPLPPSLPPSSSTSFHLPLLPSPSFPPSPSQYLRDTLTPFVHRLMDEFSEDDCEVDPTKIPSLTPLAQNQTNLTTLVTSAWGDILKSFTKFPTYVTTLTFTCTVPVCSLQVPYVHVHVRYNPNIKFYI